MITLNRLEEIINEMNKLETLHIETQLSFISNAIKDLTTYLMESSKDERK